MKPQALNVPEGQHLPNPIYVHLHVHVHVDGHGVKVELLLLSLPKTQPTPRSSRAGLTTSSVLLSPQLLQDN